MPQDDSKDLSCGSSRSSSISSGSRLHSSLFKYEAKRAGGVYEQMMRILRAGNNSNILPRSGIRDVQVHTSEDGKNTRVETELQPSGATADLNINIIMDSDSNLSNVIGHPSIEYESLDQTGGSDDGPTTTGGTEGQNTAESSDGLHTKGTISGVGPSSRRYDPNAGFGGSGSDGVTNAESSGVGGGSSFRISDDELHPSSTLSSSQGGRQGAGGGQVGGAASPEVKYKQFSSGISGSSEISDHSDESTPTLSKSPGANRGPSKDPERSRSTDSDSDEEVGEGEEGDMDDAQRHFQRYLEGEKVDALRGPVKEGEDARETKRKIPVGHLEKEGVVIGCMGVFADVHLKEYIVFLSDEMIQAFLVDPGRFRSVAIKTKCEIEVTRRILNRRMGRYRWLKYLIVVIRGPTYSAIDQCDKMMIMLFPPFKSRKPYGMPAMVSLFLKETTPDNTELYFNFQRTGPAQHMFGEIPLRAPFRRSKARPIESTPWKAVAKRQQMGVLEPKNDRMETLMSHVYPMRGGTVTSAQDHTIKWAEAAEKAVLMCKSKEVSYAQMLKARKTASEPLYANMVAGE